MVPPSSAGEKSALTNNGTDNGPVVMSNFGVQQCSINYSSRTHALSPRPSHSCTQFGLQTRALSSVRMLMML